MSLADKIAEFTNTMPKVIDPEDDISDTVAQLCEKMSEDDHAEVRENKKSKYISLDEATASSSRYAGKVTECFDEFENDDAASDDFEDAVHSFKTKMETTAKDLSEQEDDSELESIDSEASVDSEESENGKVTQKFSEVNLNNEIEKGKAVQQQLELWNKLCECRIKLQKLLVAANQLPQYDIWDNFIDLGSKICFENLSKGYINVNDVLKKFVNLQTSMLLHNPDTKDIVEQSENNFMKVQNVADDCENFLAKRYKSFVSYRSSVIQKWDEKTRLSFGRMTQKSFNAFDQAALKQIDQILRDKERLFKRTQLKRSSYKVLGKSLEVNEQLNRDEHLKYCDTEIFDDDDFYRQLLKDVIESKSAEINPLILSKHLEIQKIRSKLKRKVDTKASKGRKIRYDVHPKLVNFMAPVNTCTMSDSAKDGLFRKLFEQDYCTK